MGTDERPSRLASGKVHHADGRGPHDVDPPEHLGGRGMAPMQFMDQPDLKRHPGGFVGHQRGRMTDKGAGERIRFMAFSAGDIREVQLSRDGVEGVGADDAEGEHFGGTARGLLWLLWLLGQGQRGEHHEGDDEEGVAHRAVYSTAQRY